MIDGFVIRGGFAFGDRSGGAILGEDAAPLLRWNVIEENTVCRGSGIALIDSAVSSPGMSSRECRGG